MALGSASCAALSKKGWAACCPAIPAASILSARLCAAVIPAAPTSCPANAASPATFAWSAAFCKAVAPAP